MKKLIYSLLVVIVAACGRKEPSVEDIIASKDIEAIRAKKKALSTKKQAIDAKIVQLSDAIEKIDPNKKVPLVTTLAVKSEIFNHYIELQGNVQTKQNLVLTPEYAGILTKVYVKEGQAVKKGQILAKIDDGGLGQQLAQMQIQSELAKTTFERQERLWNQKIGSEIQYLQAKTSYEAQKKAVSQMRQNLAKTIIRAPFSGRIDDVITEKGAVVAPGQTPIIRIVNLNQMYVEAFVPERYISSVKKGTTVNVEFPVLNQSVDAKIRQAGSFINPTSRTYTVEVAVPNKQGTIKPNLTAKLKINDYTNPKALLIPQNLISENAEGVQYVYAIAKNAKNETIAKQQTIATGKTQGSTVEVLSGIKANDQLISEGARSVKNNQVIEVLK